MFKLTLALVIIIAAALIACGTEPQTEENLPHPGCTLTYAAGEPRYQFTVGEPGRIEGGVLADGDCSGLTQSLTGQLPSGLMFGSDRGGRRWFISGTPTAPADDTLYQIKASAKYSGSDRTTYRKIWLQVVR